MTKRKLVHLYIFPRYSGCFSHLSSKRHRDVFILPCQNEFCFARFVRKILCVISRQKKPIFITRENFIKMCAVDHSFFKRISPYWMQNWRLFKFFSKSL